MDVTQRAIDMAVKEFRAIGQDKVDHINMSRQDSYINGLVGYVMHYYPSANREELYSAVESMFLGVESEDW